MYVYAIEIWHVQMGNMLRHCYLIEVVNVLHELHNVLSKSGAATDN